MRVLFTEYDYRTGILILRTVVDNTGLHVERIVLKGKPSERAVLNWINEWAKTKGIDYTELTHVGDDVASAAEDGITFDLGPENKKNAIPN